MDIVNLLDRCIDLERAAGAVYRTLAGHTGGDGALTELWTAMARDEDEHARKLGAWRTLAAAEPASRREVADGFERDLAAIEAVMRDAHTRACRATTADDAFAIAFDLERSELDDMYTTLLQASPIARFPDASETYRHETAGHHAALIAAARARPMSDAIALAVALLEATDRDAA